MSSLSFFFKKILFQKLSGFYEITQFKNRLSLVVHRLERGRVSIYEKDNISFINDYTGDDSNGARQLIVRQLYSEFINLALNFSNNNLVILDIGGNNGGFILSLLLEKIKLSKVVTVEFNYKTYLRLHFNVLYNLDKSTEATVLHAAVTSYDGHIYVNNSMGSTGQSIYNSNSNIESSTSSKIRTITLDSIYKSYFENHIIDICKIDIEGAEYEVFYSNHISMLKNVRFIIIEIHQLQNQNRDKLISKICSENFEVIKSGNTISPDVFLFKNTTI